MSSRVSTTARVYAELKACAVNGVLPSGRLDLSRLADRHRASPIPVREALARLAAEGLVAFAPAVGYHAQVATPARLHDLYAWNAMILDLALQSVAPAPAPAPEIPEDSYPASAGALFAAIVARHPNTCLRMQTAQVNDLLFHARACEAQAMPSAWNDLHTVRAFWRAGALTALRCALADYHQTRMARAADIATAMAGSGRSSDRN